MLAKTFFEGDHELDSVLALLRDLVVTVQSFFVEPDPPADSQGFYSPVDHLWLEDRDALAPFIFEEGF